MFGDVESALDKLESPYRMSDSSRMLEIINFPGKTMYSGGFFYQIVIWAAAERATFK